MQKYSNDQGPLLLTYINYIPIMDKYAYFQ